MIVYVKIMQHVTELKIYFSICSNLRTKFEISNMNEVIKRLNECLPDFSVLLTIQYNIFFKNMRMFNLIPVKFRV